VKKSKTFGQPNHESALDFSNSSGFFKQLQIFQKNMGRVSQIVIECAGLTSAAKNHLPIAPQAGAQTTLGESRTMY
jgi:hypothetical protein